MAALLITVLKSLNILKFIRFYPILIKFTSKCMSYQDFSSAIHSSATLRFLLSLQLYDTTFNYYYVIDMSTSLIKFIYKRKKILGLNELNIELSTS